MAEQNNQILLETKDLQKHFPIKDFFGRKKQAVKAVDGITFQIRKGCLLYTSRDIVEKDMIGLLII